MLCAQQHSDALRGRHCATRQICRALPHSTGVFNANRRGAAPGDAVKLSATLHSVKLNTQSSDSRLCKGLYRSSYLIVAACHVAVLSATSGMHGSCAFSALFASDERRRDATHSAAQMLTGLNETEFFFSDVNRHDHTYGLHGCAAWQSFSTEPRNAEL